MSRTLRFAKMHGAGNDYVVLDGIREALPELGGGIDELHRDGVLQLIPRHRFQFGPVPHEIGRRPVPLIFPDKQRQVHAMG